MVTVRALASILVTVTTASTGSVMTATLGWASALTGSRKANTGQAVFMGKLLYVTVARSAPARCLTKVRLVRDPVAPARGVGAHLLAEVGQLVHHFLLEGALHRRHPAVRHGDHAHLHVHPGLEGRQPGIRLEVRNGASVALCVAMMVARDMMSGQRTLVTCGGKRNW